MSVHHSLHKRSAAKGKARVSRPAAVKKKGTPMLMANDIASNGDTKSEHQSPRKPKSKREPTQTAIGPVAPLPPPVLTDETNRILSIMQKIREATKEIERGKCSVRGGVMCRAYLTFAMDELTKAIEFSLDMPAATHEYDFAGSHEEHPDREWNLRAIRNAILETVEIQRVFAVLMDRIDGFSQGLVDYRLPDPDQFMNGIEIEIASKVAKQSCDAIGQLQRNFQTQEMVLALADNRPDRMPWDAPFPPPLVKTMAEPLPKSMTTAMKWLHSETM